LQTLNEQFPDAQSELNLHATPFPSFLPPELDFALHVPNEQFPDSQSELNLHEAPFVSSFLPPDLALQTLNEQLPDSQSELNLQAMPLPRLLPALAVVGEASDIANTSIKTGAQTNVRNLVIRTSSTPAGRRGGTCHHKKSFRP
jgi:hypothetical protein